MTHIAHNDRMKAMRESEGQYHSIPGLRPLTPVKRDWRGSGRIWKAAAFCAAGSVAFAIVVLFSLQVFLPGAF